MPFTNVYLCNPKLSLKDLTAVVRQIESSGRSLIAISRFEQLDHVRMTALTMEFSGSVPASDVVLSKYDCVAVPEANGKQLVCVGQCVVDSSDACVAAHR
jgi:hypothetical protein